MPKDNNDPETGFDANALSAIREMLSDEPPMAPLVARKRDVPKPAKPPEQKTVPPHQEQMSPDINVSDAVRRPQQDAMSKWVAKAPAVLPSMTALKERVMAYRPSRVHLIIGGSLLLVVFRPWLVVGLIFLLIVVTLGVFWVLGYDGFWRRSMALGRWYARCRPARAALIHRKLDSFAMKWDSVLDRLPEGKVDGLYLPDFGELAAADRRHDIAMDKRLDGLREN